MARRRPPRWSRRCSMPAASTRPSSMAASSTPTAPMRAWAPATGWWSRPTRPTAPSSSCRPTSRWSPISIPSISTTTARSTRSSDAFRQFVENMPFYGFAVMCIDHPEVQALIGRIEDRRIITYGVNPQADVRCTDLGTEGAQDRSSPSLIRDRLTRRRRGRIDDLVAADARRAQCPERHRRRSPSPTNSASPTRRSARASPASAASSAASPTPAPGTASRSSTTTATIRSRSPRCSRRRARSPTGKVIAVVQPHRYTRLRDLFDEFCACFNDADMVIVAPVYAAGEAPIEGVDPRRPGRGAAAARPSRCARRSTARRRSPRSIARAWPKPGDYVVCLGAGSITQWAYALPGELAKLGHGVSERRPPRPLGDRPRVRGRLTPDAPLAPFTWFRVGGPAELLFQPADADDLALSCRRSTRRSRSPSSASAPTSWCATAASTGVVIRLSAKGFGQVEPRGGQPHPRRRGAARQAARRVRAGGRARRLRLLSTAFPARSAARCA